MKVRKVSTVKREEVYILCFIYQVIVLVISESFGYLCHLALVRVGRIRELRKVCPLARSLVPQNSETVLA